MGSVGRGVSTPDFLFQIFQPVWPLAVPVLGHARVYVTIRISREKFKCIIFSEFLVAIQPRISAVRVLSKTNKNPIKSYF